MFYAADKNGIGVVSGAPALEISSAVYGIYVMISYWVSRFLKLFLTFSAVADAISSCSDRVVAVVMVMVVVVVVVVVVVAVFVVVVVVVVVAVG